MPGVSAGGCVVIKLDIEAASPVRLLDNSFEHCGLNG